VQQNPSYDAPLDFALPFRPFARHPGESRDPALIPVWLFEPRSRGNDGASASRCPVSTRIVGAPIGF